MQSLAFGTAAVALTEHARARLHTSPRVGARVSAALDRQEPARVMILFKAPETPSGGGAAGERSPRARTRAGLVARFAHGEFHLRRHFESINAIAGDISAAGVLRLLDDPDVLRVDLDEGGAGHLLEALPLMTLDTVQALGFTGSGVTVAVIDSGVDTDHPDLADSVVAQQCFCSGGGGCCPGGGTTQSGPGAAEDDNGHGTNVTGIITSNGTVAPRGGAPDASIVAVKVLDSTNSFCCSSDVVAALDWVLNNQPDVDVINMSLGTFALFGGDCDGADATTIAFATVINALKASGVTVFASSGNQASGTSMAAPACVANTVSVGAVYDSNLGAVTVLGCTDPTTAADQVTCFTNADASTDVFAPGARTTATGLGGGTSTFTGTSQASPATAACAAALLQSDPTLSPDQIETALESSPTVVTDTTNGLSFPRVDCAVALESVTATAACPGTPVSGCRTALRSSLILKDTDDARDKLIWKWIKGQSTTQVEFGDPTATAEYSLCMYSGAAQTQAFAATVPANGTTWKLIGDSGYKLIDPAGAANGILKVVLKAGTADNAKILVKGRGVNLPDPNLSSLTAPIVVQLRNSDSGLCWQTSFDASGILQSDAERFKAKAGN